MAKGAIPCHFRLLFYMVTKLNSKSWAGPQRFVNVVKKFSRFQSTTKSEPIMSILSRSVVKRLVKYIPVISAKPVLYCQRGQPLKPTSVGVENKVCNHLLIEPTRNLGTSCR